MSDQHQSNSPLRNKIKRNLDLALATALFVITSVVALQSYAHLREIERPENALIRSLQPDKNLLLIKHGALCVGNITTNLKYEGVWGVKSNGVLRTKYGQVASTIRFDIEGLFNPLGQLNSGRVEIDLDGRQAWISAINPHPITIHARSELERLNFDREFSVPGPITISKNPDNSFRIDYTAIDLSRQPAFLTLQIAFGKGVEIDLVRVNSVPTECLGEESARFDLLPLMHKVQPLLQSLLLISSNKDGKESAI